MQSAPQAGYTLIELLVVVAIIALLMAVLIVPGMRNSEDQALAVAASAHSATAGTAVRSALSRFDFDPTSLNGTNCTQGGYLRVSGSSVSVERGRSAGDLEQQRILGWRDAPAGASCTLTVRTVGTIPVVSAVVTFQGMTFVNGEGQ